MTHIDPTADAFAAFAKKPLDGPINMLNLVRFRATAQYADGRAATGREAYATYSAAAAPFFAANGGKVVWRGIPFAPVIGPATENWDTGFVAQYPSKDHFIAMVKSEGYQAIVFHRQAAVEDSRLFAFAATDGGDAF